MNNVGHLKLYIGMEDAFPSICVVTIAMVSPYVCVLMSNHVFNKAITRIYFQTNICFGLYQKDMMSM